MQVSIVVAKTKDNVIGKDGEIPWNIPVDRVRFREITEGGTVIMGRKTYESIGKPLTNRKNIVLSTTETNIEGCHVADSMEEAFELCDEYDEVFVIGGEGPYREVIDDCDKIYMTVVDDEYEGDTFFPDINRQQWDVANWENQKDHHFMELERKE